VTLSGAEAQEIYLLLFFKGGRRGQEPARGGGCRRTAQPAAAGGTRPGTIDYAPMFT